jgi:hypothetical protein
MMAGMGYHSPLNLDDDHPDHFEADGSSGDTIVYTDARLRNAGRADRLK